jgi:hypothetical protein
LVNLKDVFEGLGGDVMDLGKNLKWSGNDRT